MKFVKIKNVMITCLGLFLISSCSDEFFDVDSNGLMVENGYYQNEIQAFSALTAVYDVVGWETFVGRIAGLNAASDDFYVGGGNSTDVNELQVWSTYTLNPAVGPQGEYWKKGYQGVYRANTLLQKLPNVPMSQSQIDRFTAEAKSLRAYFYFDLVRFFKKIPLITKTLSASEYYNIPQAAPEEVFAQIEKDLIEAIPNLPTNVPATTEGGRLTQCAARALLGRVYLWQNKYALAAEQLELVNGTPGQVSPYGNKLLGNFADLWDAKNKYNSESIFEVSHSNVGNWGDWGNVAGSEGNILNQMVGPRNYEILNETLAPDYVSGYSFNPVTEDLFNAFPNNDPRKKATILNMRQLVLDGVAKYTPGYNDTGYFLEKFAGRKSNRHGGGGAPELNWNQNTYDIRLADTYLMEAEALVRGGGNITRAQALLDAVRARVSMPLIPATEDNIFNERRLELAGEGHRWFDLIRTGRAATVLAGRGFVPGTHEILPIPLLELTNTLLKQNSFY